MKKMITAAVSFALVASMCACGGSSSSSGTETAAPETATESSAPESETETAAPETESAADETGSETEAAEPETEFDESDPAAYITNYDVKDYVTLGEYKGLEYTLQSTEYTKEELEDMHAQYAQAMAEYDHITDRAVADGDTVNIDYSGVLEGETEPFEGGTDYGASLTIGSGSFIDGFESGLVGVNAGDTVDLEMSFPEDYHEEDYAGKAVTFTVTVNYIQGELIVPEFDDTLVTLLSTYGYFSEDLKTVEDFDQYMNTQLASSVDDTQKSELTEKLIANCTFTGEYPQRVLDRYSNNFISYYREYAASYGLDLEALLAAMGSDMESFQTEADAYAESAVQEDLASYAVFLAEGYDVDKFYEEEGLSYLQKWGIGDRETAASLYPDVMLKAAVSYAKGLDILKEYGTGVEETEAPETEIFTETETDSES